MKKPVEYTLVEPIVFGSERIEKLTFQPMKAKHLRKAGKDFGLSDLIDIAGNLAGISPAEMGEVSAEDTLAIVDIISGFLGRGQKSGADSTQP